MGRDPSFDPDAGDFDADDPSGAPFFRQAPAIVTSSRRLARPSLWEQIGSQTGRRVRDSFMPGSGVLSLAVMQRMAGFEVCENQDFIDLNGSGLGPLGPADDDFFATGECRPYGVEAFRTIPRQLRVADEPICELPER
jgi:hypothetical protein